MAADDVRPCLNTGPWYPSDPVQLGRMLEGLFQAAQEPQKSGPVRGIIAPHAGFEYSGYGGAAPTVAVAFPRLRHAA